MSKQTVDEKIQEALRDKAFDEFYLIYAKAKDAILDNEFLWKLQVKVTYGNGTSEDGVRPLKKLIEWNDIIDSDQFKEQRDKFVDKYVDNHLDELVRKVMGEIK